MSGETRLNKEQWQDLIPHQGGMCLLEEVESWNERAICCVTQSHRNSHNPLRRSGRLSALHLAEYGAQAMAVHGGLQARAQNRRAPPGFLAALRDLRLQVHYIDDIEAPLEVRAEVLSAGEGGWVYAFRVTAATRELATGRVSVIHIREQIA
jgi:predicted hotdog family 3-hydroxylacyl-ACP dehydratase